MTLGLNLRASGAHDPKFTGTDTAFPKNDKITFFGSEQYMYPRPLMHVRLSIFCYSWDLICLTGGKEKRDHRQARVTIGYGFPVFVGGLSCNISGVTSRLFKVCDLEMVLCSLFHLSHSVVIPFNCNEPLRLRLWGHVPAPWEHKAQWCLGVAPSVFLPLRLYTSGMRP